ncbi:MAG TPA: HDOD domain-containing protein [bacterium]|nr:HDOD domain-containing protein [bacterium]
MDASIKYKREKIDEIIDLVNNSYISSIEKVVTEIIRVINDSRSSAKDLKEIIEVDPPLTGKVLKRANSAFYARRRRISEIQQAIILIGFDMVQELALSQKVYELFMNDDTIYGYSRISLWKHSVAVAIFAKMIYRREYGERGDNAYAAGLLHTLGIIIEDQFLHDQFVEILKISKKEEINLDELEYEVFGFNNADIGKAITNTWDLPVELVNAIGYHHQPGRVHSKYAKITKTLFIADYICQKLDLGYSHSPFHDGALFQSCLRELGLRDKALEYIISEVQLQVKQMEKEGWFQHVA